MSIATMGAQETVRGIRHDGGEAIAIVADVTEPASVCEAVATAVRQFGALHVLFNCAGGSSMQDGPVTEVVFEEFWRAIKLDLWEPGSGVTAGFQR
ncbi:MAG: SDR family oxidoreductase [Burkholderiaceae bacterium]